MLAKNPWEKNILLPEMLYTYSTWNTTGDAESVFVLYITLHLHYTSLNILKKWKKKTQLFPSQAVKHITVPQGV